jgi:hypothetical protein
VRVTAEPWHEAVILSSRVAGTKTSQKMAAGGGFFMRKAGVEEGESQNEKCKMKNANWRA